MMVWRKCKQHIKDAANNQARKIRFLISSKINFEGLCYRKEAAQELLKHYKAVFQFWWVNRDRIKPPDLKAHEAEFLPNALALQLAPVSPSGRWVARILMSLLGTFFLWALLGKIDIIVVGQGKIIAGGYTKAIAAVEVAKVVSLNVEEGQSVKAGDLLIELDARGPNSEKYKADGERQLALLQVERSRALLQSLDTNNDPILPPMEGVDQAHYQNEVKHLQDQWRDYEAKRLRIASQIKRFGNALPLAAQKARDYEELSRGRDVSIHAYFEKKQAWIDLLGQLEDAKAQMTGLTAEARKIAQADLYQATRIWAGAMQDINKAQAHSEQMRIVSPVDGVVQQLTVHAVGGVVPAAQPLMFIVPDRQSVELEAYVENKDIGFMKEGQTAQVKVDAYDYTKYGTVAAVVTHISRDAVDFSDNGIGLLANKDITPKKRGGTNNTLFYSVRVRLQNPTILVDGKEMRLSPGMSGAVEIRTGERRIIEYVLSPLVAHIHESLRER